MAGWYLSVVNLTTGCGVVWCRALDETSQAVVQPIEQLERVQRVADAWQVQVG
jgi:hypothetical protein